MPPVAEVVEEEPDGGKRPPKLSFKESSIQDSEALSPESSASEGTPTKVSFPEDSITYRPSNDYFNKCAPEYP